MKKLALTAVTALAATSLTAAAVVPAAGDTKVHTKRFVAHKLASHSLGANTFAGADVDRHAGNLIGYDSFTGHFYPGRQTAKIWFSIALKNGTITAVAVTDFQDPGPSVYAGRIRNGTGKYKGIQGTFIR